MQTHFGTNLFPVNTNLFASAFPRLVQQFGNDKELDLEVNLVRPRVYFSEEANQNMKLQAEIRYGIKERGSMNYLIYDQM